MSVAPVGYSAKNRFRSADVVTSTSEDVSFHQLGLPPFLVTSLSKAGFEKPSPIQVQAIPLARYGADLIVQAKAGTGKTCVFAVAALETVDVSIKAPQVVVLAPTREIAIQVQEVINAIGRDLSDLKCRSFIGGMSIKEDVNQAKRCHIVVGTPGRIKHMVEERTMDLSALKVFVMDEADKLLDEKFEKIVNWICSVLPERKQMMAFSATYPEPLARFLKNYMRDPLYVRLDTDSMALLSVKQLVFYRQEESNSDKTMVEQQQLKESMIEDILKKICFNQCLIFCNLHAHAEQLTHSLKNKGWSSAFIAGSQTQSERNENMRKMKNYEIRVFVCTDLISRGIDLEHVDLVINVDTPQDWKTYIHRVGRAGRFGDRGAAITLCTDKEDFAKIESAARKCHISKMMLTRDLDNLPSSFIADDIQELQQHLVQEFKKFNKHELSVLDQGDTITSAESDYADQKLSNDNNVLTNGRINCVSDVSQNDLTIPEEMFTELDGLVRMYNSIFNAPARKVKLNVDEFTYRSFSEHYSHFNQTGEFLDKREWIDVETEQFKPLKLRNFLKPVSKEKVKTKESSTQTEKEVAGIDGNIHVETGGIEAINRDRKKSEILNERLETNGTGYPAQFYATTGSYHQAYLNSASHRYMTTMLNLYYQGAATHGS